ncbi:MAG: hypothetical protein QNJ04_10710 [Desulfobacterales bacterium]|nr:hypothetical protein [Desulfobacterales bacterium]
MKTLLTISKIALLIVLLPLHVQASTYSTRFWNSHTTDAIYLFVYDDSTARDVIFQDVSLRNPSGWAVLDHTDTYIHLGGTDAADPGSVRFNITFSDGPGRDRITDFRLEWAEYLDGLSIDSGTLSRNGNNWRVSNDFNSAVPTPIPGSTWLLLSGIFFLVGVRRHSRK